MKSAASDIQPVLSDSFGELGRVAGTALPDATRVCVVGDTNTSGLYGEKVVRALSEAFPTVEQYTFPAGEEHKNLDSIRALLGFLIDHHFDRRDALFALGGGVVGDMTGFAAAVYLRGIAFVQLPTTLLAQIDSSIGGKTGVDYNGYKNMVGAFHMPSLVYVNCRTLSSLPDDQFISGMGEVVKSALLADQSFCVWLDEHADGILNKDPEILREMIQRTEQIKIDIVAQDPTEQGIRAYLNLGHTIGHAVEKAKHFTMQHGVCVSLGILSAAYISFRRGYLTESELSDITGLCAKFHLPRTTDGLVPEEILSITKSDKKMRAGRIRFVLLRHPGEACLKEDVTDEEILAGIRYIMS